ncbi:MAG: hypothetical protein V4564_09465 [Pseudomonadota bacterium]
MMIRIVAALLALTLITWPIAVSAKRVPPKDECARDPGLAATLRQLHAAHDKRDARPLLDLINDDVLFSFGDGAGKADFIRAWKLDRNPQRSAIWAELGKVLALGCALDRDKASIPHFYARAGAGRDGFATWIPIVPNVNLRRMPRPNAPVVKMLRWDILSSVGHPSEVGRWAKVETDERQAGYVRTDLLQNLAGYRILLSKSRGRWRINTFVTGD